MVSTTQRARNFDIYKFVLTLPGILIGYSFIFATFFIIKSINPNGNNPILLQLGPLTFRWYGVLITIGVVIALYMAMYLADRRGENADRAWTILPILLVFGIGFARLWYVVNTWDKYKNHIFNFGDANNPGVFEIWNGGIAIQGAVVGGIIGVLIYKYFTGIKFFRWADFIMPGLILAQAIGRWGNFFNNEAYGDKTSLPWGIKIPCEYRTHATTPGANETGCPSTALPNSAYPPETTFHPTFFYESVWNYAVFLTLLFMIMYPKKVERFTKVRLRDGDIFFSYLVLYSIGRFFVEQLRTDSLYFIGNPVDGGIRSAQALAIVGIFAGVIGLFVRHRNGVPDSEALAVRIRPRTRVATAAADSSGDAVMLADSDTTLDEDAPANDIESELEADTAGKFNDDDFENDLDLAEAEKDAEISAEDEEVVAEAERDVKKD